MALSVGETAGRLSGVRGLLFVAEGWRLHPMAMKAMAPNDNARIIFSSRTVEF
jgi:hypothetical protein